MLTFLLWWMLFIFCWPLAILALIAYPFVWLAAALPHRRSRRSRSSGNHLHRDHSPLQAVGCAVSNLVRLEYVP